MATDIKVVMARLSNAESAVSSVGNIVARYGLAGVIGWIGICLLYTSPSPRDVEESRMPSSA